MARFVVGAGHCPRPAKGYRVKVSIIATVYNEAAAVGELLDSLLAQERLPDEVVICDGGSWDSTVAVLESYQGRLPLKVVVEPGANISQGRNRAIAAASGEIIASTDAGVRLDRRWLAELMRPFEKETPTPQVVSGFFVADSRSTFELALGATTLPEADEIDPETFLPSSRSMAFLKSAWEAVGGYPEWLDYGEDLVFDLALKRAGFRFAWAPQAVVYFRPRPSLGAFLRQYYRYARGDGKADLWRARHAIRYGAYLGGLGFFWGGWRQPGLWALLAAGVALHLRGPYRRLWLRLGLLPPRERVKALAWVPLLRAGGDVAKMVGYPVGVWWRWRSARRARGSALVPAEDADHVPFP